MIKVNKKLILLFSMASISHFSKPQTVVFSRELFQEQNVSLFLLVQDLDGLHRGGVFNIDQDNQPGIINAMDLQTMKDDDDAFAFTGAAGDVVDYYDASFMNRDVVYFEIADDVKIIKALLISKSILEKHFISVIDIPVNTFSSDSCDFECEDFGFGDVAAQKAMIAQNAPAPQKHFSLAQWYALAKISMMMQYEKGKQLCSSLQKQTGWLTGWLTKSNKKTL